MCFPNRRKHNLLFLMFGIMIGVVIALVVRCIMKKCRMAERAIAGCRCELPTPDCEPDSDT